MRVLPELAGDHDQHIAPPNVADGEGHRAESPENPVIGLFQDVPRRVWAVYIGAWATVFGLFALFFTSNAAAAFVVTIAGLFALMAFGLPMVIAAQSKCPGHDCRGIVQTRTGPLSVGQAGIQIALVPIAAVIGLIAFILLAK